MGRKRIGIAACLGCALALLLGAGPLPASAQTRNRALDRALEGGKFDAGESAQIAKAFGAAVKAGVEERDAISLVEACAAGGFEGPQIQRVLSLATQLALEHLPASSFTDKVEEGVAKRVKPAKVVQVAEARALALTRAKGLVNALALDGNALDGREQLIPDVAAALDAGRDEDDLRRVLTEAAQAGESVGAIRRKLFP